MTTPSDMTADQFSDDAGADDLSVPEADEATWAAIIADVNANEAPRTFWLCQMTTLDANAVVGWGLAFDRDERAVLFTERGTYRAASAERIHALLSRTCPASELRLVWVEAAAHAA